MEKNQNDNGMPYPSLKVWVEIPVDVETFYSITDAEKEAVSEEVRASAEKIIHEFLVKKKSER